MIRASRCAALVVLAACSGASEPPIVTDAEASAAIETSLANLATRFVGGDATGAMAIASPSEGCVTSAASSASTTYHYADCDGVTGDVNVAWSVSGPTFHLDVTASSLVVGRVSISSWTASADVTASGAQRTMIWQSTASGSVAMRGAARAFSRDVDATISWTVGESCVDVEGQASGTIDALHLATRTTSFVACDGACPNSGSELRADDVDHPGVFVRVLYGAGTATYVNERGESSTFVPACASP